MPRLPQPRPTPGSPRHEYARLLAAGVNPSTAEVLACHVHSTVQRQAAEDTRRYAADRERRRKRRYGALVRPCTACGRAVRNDNLVRHRRTHHTDRRAA